MYDYLKHIPCGTSIPFDNPHAVSVSLPTICDVIKYEEADKEILEKMKSGYPRFFRNRLVQQLVDYIKKEKQIPENYLVVPISSLKAYTILCEMLNVKLNFIELSNGVFLLIKSDDKLLKIINDYIRNAGLIISSRQAEKILFDLGLISQLYKEERKKLSEANKNIYKILTQAYNVTHEHIVLTNSGANAVFSVCEAIIQKNILEEKKGIVQLGWLYLDTMEIIQKRGDNNYWQVDVYDLEKLELWLKKNYKSISLLVTEVVSNPKLDCVDVQKLYSICQKYNIKLLLDVTLITPFNFNVLQYCDIAVESLSKFACGNGDLLMGAIVSKNLDLLYQVKQYVIKPFKGEIERLGFEILRYRERIENISLSTQILIDFFSNQPEIKQVLSVKSDKSYENYKKIATSDKIPGLISIVFNKSLSNFYDFLEMPKGPSLGTEFTLVMPYVYLAHYDLLQTEKGRNYLLINKLESELLRVSVGLEQIQEILVKFKEVFTDVS
ncbi:PLP-dependent transferase [Flavobacterium columnare]|uniref:Cystathionine gamma-synthase n=3 Tax=Flavobacterium TaxID=237 RepID=A0A2N9P8U5_9FLAO|nr:PLP-dependent transferase [Flavobacterium columnare]RVU91391.1 PLP-dependent transferase [Flavobacterium columnare]SPE76747.1 Cystathionine gamma-synthase [Flavobacterium columnare]